MNKRTRLLVLLAVIALCFVFLWPSISWYGRTPKEVQQLALGSTENIKNYAELKAAEDVRTIKKLDLTSAIAFNIRLLHSAFGINPGCAISLPIFTRRRIHEMKLVIAEKPSVAQSIARVIGAAGRKVPDRTLFRLYHHHGLFCLYADLRQHSGTHGLAEGRERQI